jgi:hypothetical protein
MVPMLLAPILSQLAGAGLQKVADAVLDKGVEHVEEKLGIKLTPNEDGVLDDSKLADLQMAAMKHAEFMAEIDLKNTQDARDMQEKAMENADPVVRRFVYVFAAFWSLFAVSYIIIITLCNIPEKNIRFVDVVLGFIMGTVVSTILNFFFGSSQSSKDKTKELLKK